jgi:hypothetical protein
MPGIKPEPEMGNASDSIPLTEDKNYRVSSEGPGRNAPYAVDGNTRTWWAPAEDDKLPWVIFDLGSASRQLYVADSVRIIFTLPDGDTEDSSNPNNKGDRSRIRHYKIELSEDGKTFQTVVDKTQNRKDNVIEFDEFKPTKCRYVRLTIAGWPQGFRRGVIEFTVFGKPWME